MTGVRMDKWLWAARFFKTRTLAARACDLGRIESNGQRAKPSPEVRAGDLLQVKTDAGDFQLEALALREMRGSAAGTGHSKKDSWMYNLWWVGGRSGQLGSVVLEREFLFAF